MAQPGDHLPEGEYQLGEGVTYEIHAKNTPLPITKQQLALAPDIIMLGDKKLSANFLLANEPVRLARGLTIEQIQAALTHPERKVL